MRQLVHQLGKILGDSIAEGRPDASLLESFLESRDGGSFEFLVRRHGPMVMGVCRRVLGNAQDVEDAFQATFLVLVRRAASVVPRENVGNWLYGVAYRTALKARATTRKRWVREQAAARNPEPAQPDTNVNVSWSEIAPAIDRELNGLPTKYRAPLVLCIIEGRSYRDAAEQLGCPEGTVAGRLSRARAMLAARLTRRGFAPVAAAAIFAPNAASAAVPLAFVESTLRAAKLVVAGQSIAGTSVAVLTERVVRSMILSKLKFASSIVLALGLGVAGVGFVAGNAAQGQTAKKAPEGKPAPKAEDTAKKLLEEQIKEVEKQNPAAAQMMRDALKKKGEESTSGKPGNSGGFATGSATATANGSGDNATKSTFTMININGKTEIKASENDFNYEVLGDLDSPAELAITISKGEKKKEFTGLKDIPAEQKAIVEKLIKRGQDMKP